MPKFKPEQMTFLDAVIERGASKWPRSLGAPYQGSKNTIARRIIDQLPPAENFVDLFGGGGAMSHAAMLSGKYKNVINNDLDGSGQDLFRKGMNGEYRDYDRFVTRDDFFNGGASGDEKILFSFGNDGRTYAFGKDIEPTKHKVHNLVTARNEDDMMEACYELSRATGMPLSECKNIVLEMKDKDLRERLSIINKQGKKIGQNLRIQPLEGIGRLNALQDIPNKDRFTFYKRSYDEVPIPENSVVYVDPPYRGTKEYVAGGFDFDKFDKWVKDNPNQVFISEYNMPDWAQVVDEIPKRQLMKADGEATYATEKLFKNR